MGENRQWVMAEKCCERKGDGGPWGKAVAIKKRRAGGERFLLRMRATGTEKRWAHHE